MVAATSTPATVLQFDQARHRYTVGDRELISVTQALTEAGLIDTRWFTEEAAVRGTRVHAAVQQHNEHTLDADALDPTIRPFVSAYQCFLMESGFRVDASEERRFNAFLGYAGTLDIRGRFPDTPPNVTNVIDLKSASVPSFVSWQTAAYARLIPNDVAHVVRRWALNLRADGAYTLTPLTNPTDWHVFTSALVVAQAKRGWL